MENENYWDKVTEDTTIEWLRRRNLLSVRSSNVLTRGAIYRGGGKTEYHPIKTVKELLEVDECELTLYRNMGKKSLVEIEELKQKFLGKSNVQKLHDTNDLISVSAFKEYLNKCKEIAQSFVDKATTRLEDSTGSFKDLEVYKYFSERVRLFEYEIPNLIDGFMKENEDGNQED